MTRGRGLSSSRRLLADGGMMCPESGPALLVDGSGGSPRGLASGLANTVFLAPQLEGDTTRESCYGHRYRPEDGDDEKRAPLITGNDATRARRDRHRGHTGDDDADRNTG